MFSDYQIKITDLSFIRLQQRQGQHIFIINLDSMLQIAHALENILTNIKQKNIKYLNYCQEYF